MNERTKIKLVFANSNDIVCDGCVVASLFSALFSSVLFFSVLSFGFNIVRYT